jgi:chorismate synthase
VRAAAKPISTLIKPLPSIDLATRERVLAHVERSDVCVVPAAGVVGEAMVALVLADALRIKFGGDSLEDAVAAYQRHVETTRGRGSRAGSRSSTLDASEASSDASEA